MNPNQNAVTPESAPDALNSNESAESATTVPPTPHQEKLVVKAVWINVKATSKSTLRNGERTPSVSIVADFLRAVDALNANNETRNIDERT